MLTEKRVAIASLIIGLIVLPPVILDSFPFMRISYLENLLRDTSISSGWVSPIGILLSIIGLILGMVARRNNIALIGILLNSLVILFVISRVIQALATLSQA